MLSTAPAMRHPPGRELCEQMNVPFSTMSTTERQPSAQVGRGDGKVAGGVVDQPPTGPTSRSTRSNAATDSLPHVHRDADRVAAGGPTARRRARVRVADSRRQPRPEANSTPIALPRPVPPVINTTSLANVFGGSIAVRRRRFGSMGELVAPDAAPATSTVRIAAARPSPLRL
jgi:hypothetical protein